MVFALDFEKLEDRLRREAETFVSEVVAYQDSSFYSNAYRARVVGREELYFLGLYDAVLSFAEKLAAPIGFERNQGYGRENHFYFGRRRNDAAKSLRGCGSFRRRQIKNFAGGEECFRVEMFDPVKEWAAGLDLLGLITGDEPMDIFRKYELVSRTIGDYNIELQEKVEKSEIQVL